MFAILGSGLLFIGVVIWTVIINKAKSINSAVVGILFHIVLQCSSCLYIGDHIGNNDTARNIRFYRRIALAILGELCLPLPLHNTLPSQVSNAGLCSGPSF